MGSTYNAGAVSIADVRESARLWLAPAQPCVQHTSVLTLINEQRPIAPMFGGQGTGVSSAADAMPATKRVSTNAPTHLGPQPSSRAG